MTNSFFRPLVLGSIAALGLAVATPASAEQKSDFKVCWSIYVGWMPWGYMQDSGILKKWADKYGISIEATQINDYVESINQYTAGAYDGCTITNMDTLSIPSASGVDTTALIVGDYSNGNDGVILKQGTTLADIKGQKVNLVEYSVSHYLLARGLDSVGLKESDLTVVNTSDADMVAASKTGDVTALVTWNPLLSTILEEAGTTEVFSSSNIPGEIIDAMMVNTQTLADNPDFGKALVGAWYETMALITSSTPEGDAAKTAMAEASGTDLAGFNAQLVTTKLFADPQDAVAFASDPKNADTAKFVAEFLFDHGILGQGAPSADFVGVGFPDGSTWGDANNVKLRFDATYMQMAADGAL